MDNWWDNLTKKYNDAADHLMNTLEIRAVKQANRDSATKKGKQNKKAKKEAISIK